MRIRPYLDNSYRFSLVDVEKQFQRKNDSKCSQISTLSSALAQKTICQEKQISDFLSRIVQKLDVLKNKYDPKGIFVQQLAYQCKFCGKKYSKSTALGGHISKIHKKQHKSVVSVVGEVKHQNAEQSLKIQSENKKESIVNKNIEQKKPSSQMIQISSLKTQKCITKKKKIKHELKPKQKSHKFRQISELIRLERLCENKSKKIIQNISKIKKLYKTKQND